MSSTQTVHTNGDDTTSKSTQQNGNQQEQYTKLKKSSEVAKTIDFPYKI